MNSTYDPLVGHVLDGRYEILAKLARGGMAFIEPAFYPPPAHRRRAMLAA